MPVPRSRITVSDPARQDLRDIFVFTLRRWGSDQLKTYRALVDTAFGALAADPHLGKPRHGYLRYTVGRHHIFYRHDAGTIYIVRILHDRMDAARHLGR